MGIILWIIFGSLVGWLTTLFLGADSEQGAFFNIILGTIGAVVGGWLMSFFGQTGVTRFDLYSFLVALLGAVVLVGAARALHRV